MIETAEGMTSRERRIAPLLVALIAGIFLAGFAKNFYLRFWLGSRPLTPLAYGHGFLMSAWLALFLIQFGLIARGRTDLHRKLGAWGAGFAALVMVVGIATIAATARRECPDADAASYALAFVAFDGLSLMLFGILVGIAILYRTWPGIHRQVMLMAMIALLPPAFGRLVAYVAREQVEVIVLWSMIAAVLGCLIVDGVRSRRVGPAMLASGAAILAVNGLTYLAQIRS